jgi:hypothetical protein
LLSSIATALATIALFYVTWVLARETKVLSRATSQAHVTATIEPNLWGVTYVDIIVENSGNAVAYDIVVEFEPPLVQLQDFRTGLKVPLQRISILRPGQRLQSSLSSFADVSEKTFSVSISWKTSPRHTNRETLSYELSMLDYEGVSYLGARSPTVQLADEVKKLREDWRAVARGSRRIKADTYSNADRDTERRDREQWAEEVQPTVQSSSERLES